MPSCFDHQHTNYIHPEDIISTAKHPSFPKCPLADHQGYFVCAVTIMCPIYRAVQLMVALKRWSGHSIVFSRAPRSSSSSPQPAGSSILGLIFEMIPPRFTCSGGYATTVRNIRCSHRLRDSAPTVGGIVSKSGVY